MGCSPLRRVVKSVADATDTGYMECSTARVGGLLPPLRPGHRSLLRSAIAWATASRSHRVICVLAGLWLINLFDLILTMLAHSQGVLDESNPVARFILPLGPTALATFKILLVGGSSAVLIRYRRRLISEATAAGMFLVYAGVAVRWRLCYEMYAVSTTTTISPADLERLEAWSRGIPIL